MSNHRLFFRLSVFSFLPFILLLVSCQQDNLTGLVPVDFSYAGYHNGDSIFRMKKLPEFRVRDFGAKVNDGLDDIDAIQAAVDSASARGGGIIKFEKGEYDFDVHTALRYVAVRHSDIVLLGAGEGPDGTILYDHTPSDYPDKSKPWLAGQWPDFFRVSKLPPDSSAWEPFDNPELLKTGINPAKMGSKILIVKNPERLIPGTTYLLTLYSEDTSLLKSLVYPLKKAAENRYKEKYSFRQMVKVVKLGGDTATLDSPVLWDLKQEWHPQLWDIPVLIHDVAIMGFHMKTAWSDPFYHHLNPVHDNGWDNIHLIWCEDCVVRSIIHENVSSAVGISSGKNCSVFDCQITGNKGHNGFVASGNSTRNLLSSLRGGQAMHTFSISDHACGNVFFNCYSDESSAIDCHAGVDVYNLFDNIYGASFQHGGSSSNLPPAHGRGLVLWNWRMGATEPYKGRIRNNVASFTEIPGFIAIGVSGLYGQEMWFRDEERSPVSMDYTGEWGIIREMNKIPEPRSLFLYQKKKRTGRDPRI